MGILRSIKSDYNMYENTALECFVAINADNAKLIKAFFKKYKGKKIIPNDTIAGYKFVLDEEFDSLKIEFEKEYEFNIKDLKKVK
ncbi:hypothetical protein [Labilibacter marinus]|uniref:hypothetical protein n=1 Tax=Labilibacter marinus TaxID=1477105 RepID=UPI00094F7783|nr:hypothetical protein [Labilibacter marinus]